MGRFGVLSTGTVSFRGEYTCAVQDSFTKYSDNVLFLVGSKDGCCRERGFS